MLSNAYFLAKFRFNAAENEPAKNLQIFANFCKHFAGHRERRQGERRRRRGRHAAAPGAPRLGRRAPLHRRGRGPAKKR